MAAINAADVAKPDDIKSRWCILPYQDDPPLFCFV